jgi:hypothetical protein
VKSALQETTFEGHTSRYSLAAPPVQVSAVGCRLLALERKVQGIMPVSINLTTKPVDGMHVA